MFSLRKADTLAVKLKEKLQSISIDRLAKQSGFVRRKPRKIKPLNFILSFFIMVLTGGYSLTTFATTIGLLSGCREAVDEYLGKLKTNGIVLKRVDKSAAVYFQKLAQNGT